jgi:hypothetical protein
MADEASDNEGQPGSGVPYEDAEQELVDDLDQDLFRKTLRDVCGLTPNQLDAFYALDIDSPDALALFDKEQLTALYQQGTNTGIWRLFMPAKQMKIHALYVWLQHKRDQEDINLETLDLSLFTVGVMKDLRKTHSRTKEYSRKKDKDSYIQVKVFLGQESQWMAFCKQLEAKYSKQDSTNGDLKMSYVIDDVQDNQFKTSRCTPPLALDTSMYALTSVPKMAGKRIVHSAAIIKGIRHTTAWPAPP